MVQAMSSEPSPTGETDLAVMLGDLQVSRRPGRFAVVTVERELGQTLALGDGIEGLVQEAEGVTAIVSEQMAQARGWSGGFIAGWLTLEIHSSLNAVGLTAAVSSALGEAGISCNVLAGYFHDHILVPIEQVADAIACLESLGPGTSM